MSRSESSFGRPTPLDPPTPNLLTRHTMTFWRCGRARAADRVGGVRFCSFLVWSDCDCECDTADVKDHQSRKPLPPLRCSSQVSVPSIRIVCIGYWTQVCITSLESQDSRLHFAWTMQLRKLQYSAKSIATDLGLTCLS